MRKKINYLPLSKPPPRPLVIPPGPPRPRKPPRPAGAPSIIPRDSLWKQKIRTSFNPLSSATFSSIDFRLALTPSDYRRRPGKFPETCPVRCNRPIVAFPIVIGTALYIETYYGPDACCCVTYNSVATLSILSTALNCTEASHGVRAKEENGRRLPEKGASTMPDFAFVGRAAAARSLPDVALCVASQPIARGNGGAATLHEIAARNFFLLQSAKGFFFGFRF